ncbi:glycoside hydrolase family 32 protein [Arthrobacter bambusae]|uniref:Sucrose-6-phosphate hydrolase SacC (GH32 family) n=1 Tax=Arthrobacter bambusae TaxID=1338426 RepID=A0AAW8DA24_9MICC|nr:glycoside hydrolase family 32 protein [Arthrobacter bambusae]MDP9904658.1 sucrose-6-phosphate hydrolase SacC (GH32 family) [Arthrobacter bambusae]MDQ0129474.1 sucrose-6-phosphate hydrolase SacC (GH32 family) [Arthrobacter bambusae]MDQ0180913.1 sucrose-6-phosphate hydrolase SacC (GH32 family) [Arthrobacter bambusae]
MTGSPLPETFADEAYRPRLHFSAPDTWINDPNGLVYADGLYHLFYQNNPYGTDHANMSWGHAVSTDLHHWEHRPLAILCDNDEQIFSGSVVLDETNSSGFGDPGTAPLVAIYTSDYADTSPHQGIQAQSLAYSNDGGQTWTKYSHNPVLSRDSPNFRDPKVFRYKSGSGDYWVMIAVEAAERKAVLYRSEDLKHWTLLSEFQPSRTVGKIWECPDLFPLQVDGDPADTKWVLILSLEREEGEGGSAGVYIIGDFDGVTFTPQTKDLNVAGEATPVFGWLDHGRDYYAAVSFSNTPGDRRIMIGWMNNWDYARSLPTSPWRGSMALPREISLHTDNGRMILRQQVVDGLEPAGPPVALGRQDITHGVHALTQNVQELRADCNTEPCLIQATLAPGSSQEFGLILRQGQDEGTWVGYDIQREQLIVDRTASGRAGFSPLFPSRETAPVKLAGDRLRLQIYLDAASIEVFAQNGQATVTEQIFPSPSSTALSLYSIDGTAQLIGLTITPLKETLTSQTGDRPTKEESPVG